jgi:hypothetical protein
VDVSDEFHICLLSRGIKMPKLSQVVFPIADGIGRQPIRLIIASLADQGGKS